ncbi:MAG: galactose-1-epimerase, partial [Prevotella sp.]|nr:galactose-1-epimerase [Prevotella sp.]
NISANHLQTIEEEILRVDADSIAVYDAKKRLTGEMMAVKGTPFDFLTPKKIGLRIDENDTQLNVTKGYDHTWRLNHPSDLSRVAAELYDKNSGITLSVYTTEPGMHIYTANGLNGSTEGKHHQRYPRRSAICFETCHFADSPNKPQFPTTVLRPGEKFHSETIFRFGRR